MTTTMHLGVLEQPYGRAGSKTTFDVAEILEAKYRLFSVFVSMHEPVIQHEIDNALRGAIETAMMGGPVPVNAASALSGASSGIEELFRDAIDMQSYDGKIPGVPTGAALRGVRHSFKRAYVRRDPRPSFFDTGLLSASFRAWADTTP
jgi:hypothetical protein